MGEEYSDSGQQELLIQRPYGEKELGALEEVKETQSWSSCDRMSELGMKPGSQVGV